MIFLFTHGPVIYLLIYPFAISQDIVLIYRRAVTLVVPNPHPESNRGSWEAIFANTNKRYDTVVESAMYDLESRDCSNAE